MRPWRAWHTYTAAATLSTRNVHRATRVNQLAKMTRASRRHIWVRCMTKITLVRRTERATQENEKKSKHTPQPMPREPAS